MTDPRKESGTRLRALRVLVVDDEAMVARALARTLRRAGLVVDTASSAAEAVAHCETTRYDIVVTDESMPGVTGTELVAILYRAFGMRRFVVCSGTGTAGPFAVPGVRVLPKPWDDARLVALLTEGTAAA